MHTGSHELFMVMAINLVVASPLVAYWLDRRGFFGEREPMVTVARGVVIPLGVLSLGAAAIHLATLPAHLRDAAQLGLIYGAGGSFGILWAVAWFRRPTRTLASVGIVGNVALVALWVGSRAGALPFVADPGAHAGMGLSEGFAAMFEVALVLGLAARLWRPLELAAESRVLSAQSASLGIAMALVAVLLLTVFGMATA